MSGLRDALVNGLTHYNFCYAEIHASEPSIATPEEVELVADAVLRVLADTVQHSFPPDEAGKNRLDTTPTKPEASGRGSGAGPSSPVEWPERQPSPTGTIERAAEVLFPIIHPHAARALETGEGVAEWDQTHVLAAQALADAGLLAPRERYASLDQLAPGDRIWLDGAWREVADTISEDGDVRVLAGSGDHFTDFLAPAALLVRRAET
jgi:hypothetical protein